MRRLAAAWVLDATADMYLFFLLFWIAGPMGWSGAQIGMLLFTARLPALLGGVLGGRIVESWGPRRAMAASAGTRAVLMVCLALVGAGGHLNLGITFVVVAFCGAAVPMSYAAARTLTPRIVDPEDLYRANAWLGFGDQLPILVAGVVLGPALGLLDLWGALLVPAFLLVLVVVITTSLPAGSARPPAAASPAAPGRWWAHPGVLPLVLLSVAYYFTYGPFEPVLPHFVRQDLGAGPGAYGALWVGFGVGALLGLMAGPALARRHPGRLNALGAATWGLVTSAMLFTDDVRTAVAVFFVSGLIWGPYSVIETTALQRWVPEHQHGRAFATTKALVLLAFPTGAMLGSVAVDHTRPVVVLACSAGACTLAGLIALGNRSLRNRTAAPSETSGSRAHADPATDLPPVAP